MRSPLLLLAVIAGCAPGHLSRTERLASGEEREIESYDFRESKLSRSEGGLVVELSRGDFSGFRLLILPPIQDVAGARIRLPADVEEEREYAIGEEGCALEIRRHTDLGLWRPLGPGTILVTRWNPKSPSLAARFRVVRGHEDGGREIWVGSFMARP